MKKFIMLIIASFITINIWAIDVTFRVTPGAEIPLKDDYGVGFGATAQIDADLFGFLTVGAEGLFNTVKIPVLDANNTFVGGGVGVGGYFYPMSRLYLGAGAGLGIYQMSTTAKISKQSYSDIYWRAYGEAGFRVSPELSLIASGGYKSFMCTGTDALLDTVNVNVGVRYTIPLGKKGSSSFITSLDQTEAAYPVYMSAYRICPFSTVTIRNNEGAEVRNVHVSFRAGKYTSSTFESETVDKIKKYGSVEVPLCADFSREILKFVENGKVAGEIVIDYEFLGKKMQVVQNTVIDVYNRNAFTWADIAALSSFISPDTPEILEFAKYVAGKTRNNFELYPGMNRNFQIAAAMTEAIRLAGVRYSEDKQTPYVEYHLSDKLDYIQYPLQTLKLQSGDYDELGILLASCLESVDVATGFLVLDNDFIVLVATDIKPGTEGNNFGKLDGLIIDEDNVYFGISMANLEKGFVKARAEAAKKIEDAINNEVGEYASVHESWEFYSPCAFNEVNGTYDKPTESQIISNYTVAVNDYINTDLATVLANARKSGDSNKIGVALLRQGRYAEAKTEFNKAGTLSALNNLANVYFVEKDYNSATNTYKKVLAKDPENRIALKGLENINLKLGL